MNKLVAVIVVLFIIILLWVIYYKWSSEVMINGIEWQEMARGLNLDAKNTKPSKAVKLLREMELAQSSDINVLE